MPDYAKTIIYKLVNYDFPELVYVGSTTNYTKRKQHHKEGCNNESAIKHHVKVYKTMRETGGWESWSMIKICDYPCNNRRESEQEEDRYMIELKSTLHMRRPFNTKESRQAYFDDRKDIKKEYDKNNRTINGDKIKEAKKVAYKKRKDENPNFLLEQREKYKLKEKPIEIFKCSCGVEICKTSQLKHIATKKHQKYLNEQLPNQ